MWYAILGEDHDNSLDKRIGARSDHLARLQLLLDEGRLLVAGPLPAIDSPEPGTAGFSGSLIIVDFPSLEDAKTWANEDPYVAAGVYRKVSVKPFKQALP